MQWIPLTEGLQFFLSGLEDPDAAILLANASFQAIKREADALKVTVISREQTPISPGAIYRGIRFRGEKTFIPATCVSTMSDQDKLAVNNLAAKLEDLLVNHHAAAINRNGLGYVMCSWR